MKTSSFLFSILLLLAVAAQAQTTRTWVGTTNDWGTASNWSPSGVPSSSDKVKITGTGLAPVLGANRTVARLYVDSDSLAMGGYTLTVSGTVTMSSGTVTGSGKIDQVAGSSDSTRYVSSQLNCKVVGKSGRIIATSSVFADSTRFARHLGTVKSECGGNVFHGHVEIENSDSKAFYFGVALPDTFWSPITVRNFSDGRLGLCHSSTGNYIAGGWLLNLSTDANSSITLFNSSTTFSTATLSGPLHLGASGGLEIKTIGSGGQLTLTASGKLKIDTMGFAAGTLILGNVQQENTTATSFTGMAAGSEVRIYGGSTFLGEITGTGFRKFNVDGSRLLGGVDVHAEQTVLNDSRFEGNVSLTRTSAAAPVNLFLGGNYFGDDFTFRHASGAAETHWGHSAPDTVMGNLSIANESTNRAMFGRAYHSLVQGNVTLQADSGRIYMGDNTGSVILCGSGNQAWTSNTTDYSLEYVKHININKPAGRVILTGIMEVRKTLALTSGIVEAKDDSYVKLRDGATLTGVSNASFVEGAVVAQGDTAFTFPIGANGRYRPLSISAPALATAEFKATYYNVNSDEFYTHSQRDTTIGDISRNEVWLLERLTTSNTVNVTLSWDTASSCAFDTLANLKVVSRDTTSAGLWKDLGNGGTTGNVNAGTVVTAAAASGYWVFALGTSDTMICNPCNRAISLSGLDDCTPMTLGDEENYKWFSFEGRENLLLTLEVADTLGVSDWLKMELFSSCSGSPIKEVNSDDQENIFIDTSYVVGHRYFIRVEMGDTISRDLILCIRGGGQSCPAPPNCGYVSNGNFDMVPTPQDVAGVSILTYCWYNMGTLVSNGNITSSDFFYPGIIADFANVASQGWPRRSGNGMCGFGPTSSNHGNPNYREFVSQNVSLVGGRTYRVTFYILPFQFDGLSKLIGFRLLAGTTNDGALTNLNINTTPDYAVSLPGTISGPFSTSANYIEVTGTVSVATTGTYWLNIGCFEPPYSQNSSNETYYRVEDVSMTEAVWITGLSTECAGGDGVTLTANGGVNYVWTSSDPDATPNISFPVNGSTLNLDPYPLSETTLTLTGTTPDGCENTHSITVRPIPGPEVTITGSDFYCPGEDLPTLVANATGGGGSYQYLWNTEATSSSIPASQGTYTVTVTGNGCPATSAPFIVTEGDAAPEIIFDIDDASCSGATNGAVAVTFDPNTSDLDWTWDPSVSGTNVSPLLNLGAGEYTVTVTNGSSCSNTATAEVAEAIEITVSFGSTDYCPARGPSVATVQNAIFPFTLEWEPSQFLQTNTGVSPEIDHSNPPLGPTQIFTLTVTDDNGCTEEFQTTMDIGDCCFGEITYGIFGQPIDLTTHNDVNNSASAWLATISPATLGANTFTINGTFTVDDDLTFEDMDVVMGPWAEIVISAGNTLTITNSHLFPCSDIWNRIEVGADADLVIEDGSILEQAFTAVHAHDGGTYDISYSTFDRNVMHMLIQTYGIGENPGTVEGNLFDCSQPITFGTLDRTGAGINILNVNAITIGDDVSGLGSTGSNVFRHARLGIRSIDSDLTVGSCVFDDIEMVDDGNGSLHPSGFGIYAKGLSTQSLTVNKYNWFKNSSYGTLGFGFGNMAVQGNLFENIGVTNEATNAPESYGYAIRSHANGGGSIRQNTLVDCEMGMYVLQQAPGFFDVHANRIEQSTNNTYVKGVGILISGSGTIDVHEHNEGQMGGATDAYIHDMYYGILAMSADEAWIHENDIEVNPDADGFSAGIAGVNSIMPKTYLNEVVNLGAWQDLTVGIYSINSSMYASCNRVVDATLGFAVQGPDPTYSWLTNTLEGTQLVSLFATETALPTQGDADYPADNRWVDGSTFGFHTYNQNPSGQPGAIYVRPLLGNPTLPDYEYQPVPFLSESNQGPSFYIEAAEASQNYNPANSCGWEYRDMAMIHGVAMDTITYLGDSVSARLWSRWTLYKAAQKDSSLQADSIVMAFVDIMKTTVLGKLDSLDSQMHWGIDSTSAKLLSDANTKITATDSISSLWKEVNGIALLKVLQLDTAYSGGDFAKLETIGALCPDKYGPAIYKARDLLTAIDGRPRLFLNACEEMDVPQMPSLRRADPNAEEEETESFGESSILVYPNPSNGSLMVDIIMADSNDQSMSLKVTDLSGKTVYQSSKLVGKNQIELRLASGSYLYSINDASGATLQNGKLVIVQ